MCLESQSCALIRSLPLAVLTRLPDFTAPEVAEEGNEGREESGRELARRDIIRGIADLDHAAGSNTVARCVRTGSGSDPI